MLWFERLNKIQGFDINDPANARQNSYAWSMVEFGDYIYIGTCRNMLISAATSFSGQLNQNPIITTGIDNNAEIWRYKKDGSCPWQRVFKTNSSDNSYGFRAMITHQSEYSCAIYAATIGEEVYVFKSEDGVHWKKLYTPELVGTSSRAFASLNGRLYIATLDEAIGGGMPYLYSSQDPEFEPFELVINPNSRSFIPSQNPVGGVDSLQVFNHKLYVGIETESGAEIWRSNDSYPTMNDWTLVADKGFGDAMNRNVMSTGVFRNHLYIAVTKELPLALFAPLGFDLIRVDKNDNWEVVVGGKPLLSSSPSTGKRNKSISGFNSGFNNIFNVYGWQIKEYENHLILTTYDASTNVRLLYEVFRKNKEQYIENMGIENYTKIVRAYSKILCLLNKYNYPKGFDLYTSTDGCHFTPRVLDGLHDPYSYGGRTLLVSCEDELYLGTANPYCGCNVWKARYVNSNCYHSNGNLNTYFNNLNQMNSELQKVYPELIEALENMFTLRAQATNQQSEN